MVYQYRLTDTTTKVHVKGEHTQKDREQEEGQYETHIHLFDSIRWFPRPLTGEKWIAEEKRRKQTQVHDECMSGVAVVSSSVETRERGKDEMEEREEMEEGEDREKRGKRGKRDGGESRTGKGG